MKNEAISLVLMAVMAQAAVDIFSGLEVTTEEATDAPKQHIGFPTCISDIYAEEPMQFDEKIFSLHMINSTIRAIPKAPSIPNLPQTWSRFTNIFQLPRFSEMGQEFKALVDQNNHVILAYANQWLGFFKQRHHASMGKIKSVIQKMNKNIHESFANHFEEFSDVCLPDSNACLQSIQKGIESYEQRLNENVAACGHFAKRQVNQHEQLVENEKEQLVRPFLRVKDCFGSGRVGISLASCVGNMVGIIAKATTDGVKRFSNAMEAASNSLTERLGKFQECVVNRKKLLDRGETRIAERAKECLRKQTEKEKGEIFGGEDEGYGEFEGDDDVFK